jgi:hypothetical protein
MSVIVIAREQVKKTHFGCNCHPYRYAWYIFCKCDFIEEDDYDKWLFTDKIEEVTCKRCLKSDAKMTAQMQADGLLNPDGSWKGFL